MPLKVRLPYQRFTTYSMRDQSESIANPQILVPMDMQHVSIYFLKLKTSIACFLSSEWYTFSSDKEEVGDIKPQ